MQNTETFTLPAGVLEQAFAYLQDRGPFASQLAQAIATAQRVPDSTEPQRVRVEGDDLIVE